MTYWPDTKLELECYPKVPDHIARPWDAADEYLFREVNTTLPTLIINDRYGALSCLFPEQSCWIDSACAIQSAKANRERNNIQANTINLTNGTPIPPQTQQVVIKIPKSFDLLKFWLTKCQQELPQDTEYWLAGMAKHIPVSWLNWLQQHSQQYQQYRIEKKARLIRLTRPNITAPKNNSYHHEGLTITTPPGVFARNNIDIGSQVLIPHLRQINHGTVCDLGCGNGLLSLIMKKQRPELTVIATDDSWLAQQTTVYNAQNNNLAIRAYHGNALEAIRDPLDWVVCNPPYHDGHKELTNIAINMFEQAAAKLKPDGGLLVVANRHLPYLKPLRNNFAQVKVTEQTSKFSVYLCKHPK